MILVTGATGKTGSEVVRELARRGAALRAFVRNREKAREVLGDEVELAIGDFADDDSVRAALEGVEDVFLSCADDPRRIGWETAAIDAAAAAGVRRIVKLSTIGAEPGAPVAFWDWHGRVDRHLRESDVAAVVLQASFSMSNVLAGAEQVSRDGRLYAPAGDARIAMIHPRDVGAAAAAVLTAPGHEDQTYVLTGPDAIGFGEVAAELSSAIGRRVEFVDVPDEAAKQALTQAGMPEFVADQIVRIFSQLRRGVAADVTDTVERLTGSPPRSFAAFVRDHARFFQPATVGVAEAMT